MGRLFGTDGVRGLVFWWSARVQGLHDAYLGGAK